MLRRAVVAGRFYPGSPQQLEEMVRQYLAGAKERETEPTLLAMVPHAGYPYSGPVAGKTLAEANLPRRLVLLGPNHTGLGRPMAVWAEGAWQIPGADIPVDAELAAELLEAVPGFQSDTTAHASEHSLEVVLPFLHALDPNVRIVPVCVSDHDPQALLQAGAALGGVLAGQDEPVALVVSSDMSHYVPHEVAKDRDSLALRQALELDPLGLYETVRRNGISMCGVLPMTMGLAAAKELGATRARLAGYATSGQASGDYGAVVGYAGLIVS